MLESKLTVTIEPKISSLALSIDDMFSSSTGNVVTLTVLATDSKGNPVEDAEVSINYNAYAIEVQSKQIKSGTAGSGTTDSNGKYSVKFTTPVYSSQTAQPIVCQYTATGEGITSSSIFSYSGITLNMYTSNSNNVFEAGTNFDIYVGVSIADTDYGPSGMVSSIKVSLTETNTGTKYTANLSSRTSSPPTATAKFSITIDTAGSFTASQSKSKRSYKKVLIYLDGYENDSTTAQTYTFPVPFSTVAVITTNSASVPVVSTSLTEFSIAPDTTTAYTGIIVIEGY